MNSLPDDIQDMIYKYKHNLEYKNITDEINKFKRHSMRQRPLLCNECYRTKLDSKNMCEDCSYSFEYKMACLIIKGFISL
jgi:hypothetical protein